MIKYKKIRKLCDQIQDIICNMCGETCRIEDQFCGINASYDAGYWSEHFEDCKSYKFDLCEGCLSKLFKKFKINPEVS